MQRTIGDVKYISTITIKSLRDYILDNSLTEDDSIVLNQIDFDELALEYRRDYKEGIVVPFFILRVLIESDELRSVPLKRIKVIRNDNRRYNGDYIVRPIETGPSDEHKYDTIYRCGYCGNMVEYNGNRLDDVERSFRISVLEKFPRTVKTEHTHGYCCRGKY